MVNRGIWNHRVCGLDRSKAFKKKKLVQLLSIISGKCWLSQQPNQPLDLHRLLHATLLNY